MTGDLLITPDLYVWAVEMLALVVACAAVAVAFLAWEAHSLRRQRDSLAADVEEAEGLREKLDGARQRHERERLKLKGKVRKWKERAGRAS
jgi:hypothetical protein